MTTIRISRRVLDTLSGTDAWQACDSASPASFITAGDLDLMRTIQAARSYKDGSVKVELDAAQVGQLRRHAQVMEAGAEDNTWDSSARADLAAARALLRNLPRPARTTLAPKPAAPAYAEADGRLF